MLNIRGRLAVIVGGGAVAARRCASLLEAGAEVLVIAPDIREELAALPIRVERRVYRTGDLAGAVLVVIATDDPAVNDRIHADARAAGTVLVNRTDSPAPPDQGDITFPAHAHHGPITLAVHTGGISASAAATIRRQLSAALDPDWVTLLEAARPCRAEIQRRMPEGERRRAALRELTNNIAMSTLKDSGPDGLNRHMRAVIERCVNNHE